MGDRAQGGEDGAAEGVVGAGVGFALDCDGDAVRLQVGGQFGHIFVFTQQDGALDVLGQRVHFLQDAQNFAVLGCLITLRIFFDGAPDGVAAAVLNRWGDGVEVPAELPFCHGLGGELQLVGHGGNVAKNAVDHFDHGLL